LRLALAILAALLWQAGDFGASGGGPTPMAEVQHLRYERELNVPMGTSGTTCAVLDGSVYAHAASWSTGDLRVFLESGSKPEEVPFVVSYSAAQPTDAVSATVENLRLQGGDIVFDLVMPQRAYTVVELQLAAKDFIGTAEVSGLDGKGGRAKALGTFAVFDLSERHLARSTSLALQESSFAQLHVKLRLRGIDGGAVPQLPAATVTGARVPASREAQTLYTAVAATNKLTQVGGATVALMDAPAHVPIERVSFLVDPAYKSDFLHGVAVSVAKDAQGLERPDEVVDGEIWRVTRERDPVIHASKLTQIAVVASNLREAAKVRVEIKNGGDTPLPVKTVELEMRQRTICFNAVAGSRYRLRYGDDELRASVYDLDGLTKTSGRPIVATLGPEELNRDFVARTDVKTYGERNPEMYWLALLATIAALGALASRHTRRRGRHR
jgi:hypothetical protein